MANKWFGPCLLVLQASCSTGPEFSTIETEQAGAALGHQGAAPVTDPDYTLFEAGAVRPIAVLPSGVVAVTNIPNNSVELFRPQGRGVTHCGSVAVGLSPVAVSAVGDTLWVVNHLSDSVSVVELDGCDGHVERTLLVGDEPRDIVSAVGRDRKEYAFVTAAHRGQNVKTEAGTYRDPELGTPGIGRGDVFVYDVAAVRRAGGRTAAPTKILTLFSDTPRALAVGNGKVYAAGFFSGNRTSVVKYQFVIGRGRTSLAALDANRDFVIDAGLPEAARIIEGGYPAIKGHGRCISAQRSSPPGFPLQSDFYMDVCVKTDPNTSNHALSIVPQEPGVVTEDCSCTDAHGNYQVTPALIVRFFDDLQTCGSNYSAAIGGCWLEPPQSQDFVTSQLNAQAWNDQIAFSLPDKDVFSIDLTAQGPVLTDGGEFRGVGTTLFNMATHPKTGAIYVSNTDALNFLRFEGPDEGVEQGSRFASTTVRGHFVENRISVLNPTTHQSRPVHLNAHIDFDACCGDNPGAADSLAIPLGIAVTKKKDRRGRLLDDQDLYVAALGSDKVAVLSTTELGTAGPNQVVQDRHDHIAVPGGPMGLAIDESRDWLYVLARYPNELVVVDTNSRNVRQRVAMPTPEPQHIIEGRRFLYDARETSSNGTVACASCHVFGDFDALSWDLGAPDAGTTLNDGPFISTMEQLAAPLTSHFLAVKGPMNTQSLRGLANHGAMHWRGDRRGQGGNAQPDSGAFDEQAAFKAFNVAFPGLNGRTEMLSDAQMQAFTDFILEVTYPPNPIRNLDDVLTEQQVLGMSKFFGCPVSQESAARGECLDGRDIDEETRLCNCVTDPSSPGCPANPSCNMGIVDNLQTCHGCHRLDPDANREFDVDKPGLFGSNANYSSDGVGHIMKVPHFRNMYQKVGMFGTVQTPFGIGLSDLQDSAFGPRGPGLGVPANAFTGDQVRGFGYLHSGEEDTMFHFMASFGFIKFAAFPGSPFPLGNGGGFEPSLPAPANIPACYDNQLPQLNDEFLASLGTPEVVAELQAHAQVLLDPTSPPEAQGAAFFALSNFVAAQPDDSPAAIFKRLGANQLTLPLVQCPALPPAADLQAQGCFGLDFFFGPCAPQAFTVRSCAQWAATLEQIMPNGVNQCTAEGLHERVALEDFLFAFDSNMKPIVGQQVTLRHNSPAQDRARLALLLAQADLGHCEVVANVGEQTLHYGNHRFVDGRGRRSSEHELLGRCDRDGPVTFTALPPRPVNN